MHVIQTSSIRPDQDVSDRPPAADLWTDLPSGAAIVCFVGLPRHTDEHVLLAVHLAAVVWQWGVLRDCARRL